MIKVSDFIIEFLERQGVRHAFMLTGGMAMHLNDSIGKAQSLKPICLLHEQSCSFAAESYARITNNLGVAIVTCGAGATNTITGLLTSWVESTPLLVISGQCPRADIAKDPALRQYGVQEVRIVDIVRPITKYAALVDDPQRIRYELERAVSVAKSGRKGPVLLDIPVDVQGAEVDESGLRAYESENETLEVSAYDAQLAEISACLAVAKRPVIYAGAGVAMAGARAEFRRWVEQVGAPVLLNWNGMDLLEEDHPLYQGRPGSVGQRAANLVLQNADVLITVGTRLSLLQTGHDFEGFAPNAKLIMVDVDETEMSKPNVRPYLKVRMDALEFINRMLGQTSKHKIDHSQWIALCRAWKEKHPPVDPAWHLDDKHVNSYCLMAEISKQMRSEDVYVGGRAGTCVDAAIQAFAVKDGQRVFVTKGNSSMGTGLPAAIAGAYATGRKIVTVIGDGGFVMNIQELACIKQDQLNIKIFVLDNRGYSTARNVQAHFFDGHYVGCSRDSGLPMTDIAEVSRAYGIMTYELQDSKDMARIVAEALSSEGPVVVRVGVGDD